MDELIPYVTDATFDVEVMQASLPVLVCCWTTKSFGSNRTFMPVLENIANEYAGQLNVIKLNVDDNQQIKAKFGIHSAPTLMLFKNGDLAATKVGAISKTKLMGIIDDVIKSKEQLIADALKMHQLITNASGKLSEELLHILVDGGSSPYGEEFYPTIDRIAHVYERGVDVTPVLRELFKSKKVNARWVALMSILRGAISLPVTDEIIITALSDKNSKIRNPAGHVATCTFRKLWLLPLLEQIVKKYPDMEFYIKLLRDGYVLSRCKDGSYQLMFGSVLGTLSGCNISISEYESLNINTKDNELAMKLIRRANEDILRQSINGAVRPIPVEEHRTVYAV